MLDAVTIDDPTSGHQVYKLRGVIATGKSIGGAYSPLITLKFATMTVTGCGPHRYSVSPIVTPTLRMP
jgi:hypothetical protein